MRIKRGRQGQFYIIAAIIIVLVLMGLAGVTNYIMVREEPEEFYDLGEVLEREGDWAYSYALYDKQNVDTVLDDFSRSFANYTAHSKEDFFDLVIVYGDRDNAKAIVFSKKESGEVNVNIGSQKIQFTTQEQGKLNRQELNIQPDKDGYINFEIENYSYEGYLKDNQNFIFYMTTEKEFERIVSTNIQQYQQQ